MPLATMAALMLIVALLADLMPETLASLKSEKIYPIALLILVSVLTGIRIEPTPEVEFSPAPIILLAALAFVALKKGGARSLLALPASAALALPAALFTIVFEGDSAVILAALMPLAVFFVLKKPVTLFFIAALTPIAAALVGFVYDLMKYGYGVFSLTVLTADIQLVGLLFVVFATELRAFNLKTAPLKKSR